MLEKRLIKEHLEKTFCHKCGSSLGGAKLVPISEAPISLVAHAVCPKCQAESMITITQTGSGIMPITSDLGSGEIKKFIGMRSVSYDDLMELHLELKKKNIWKLLQKKEKSSVKKRKA